MNKYQMVHETVARDIIDIIDDVKSFDQVDWIVNKNARTGSIAKQASNLILVFPVLCSTSISIQTATIISKAIERKCAALLQILFAAVNMTNATDIYEYIGNFHSNINKQLDLDEFLNAMDRLSESGIIQITDAEAYNAVKEDMRNLNYFLDDLYDDTIPITEFVSKTNLYGESQIVCEAKGGGGGKGGGGKGGNNGGGNKNNSNNAKVNFKVPDETIGSIASKVAKELKDDRPRTYGNANRNRDDIPSLKDQMDYFKNQLLPQDVEKANELMPTMMAVNFTYYKNGAEIRQTGIIGIKAKLYPIDSMDIVTRLASKYSDKNTLFQFVKASTREISFFKDFLFAVDKAKLDGIYMASNSNNAKIFKLLERRAAKYRFSALLRKNDASPITTLVMSQDEAEYLKRYNSLDVNNPNICKPVMNAYNLMCITIADESLEVAKFLYDDGDNIFESLSFDGLEKEAKDSSYKKVVNLMSKINR